MLSGARSPARWSSGPPAIAAAAAEAARFDREHEFSFTVDLTIEAVANRVPGQR
ncbi:MAG TPA: hypothetical protein VIR30_00520 [Nocardioides sp.]